MAKYKQVEFAKLCGIPKSSLPAYKSRKQIFVEDNLIDEDHPINAAFILKSQAKQKLKPDISPASESKNISSPETTSKVKKGKSVDYAALMEEQKRLDIQKTFEEIEKLKKQNMKMDGESMPTDIVISIFSMYGKSITTSMWRVAENWLISFSKIYNLSSTQYAEMRGILVTGINEGVLNANVESKKNINNIIKEYSLKREIGEHD